MRLRAEVSLGVAACAVAYVVARRDTSSSAQRPEPSESASAPLTSAAHERPTTNPITRSTAAKKPRQPVRSSDDSHEMATLRNEVISATSADMQRRGEDVAHCFADADLVGEQKVRFAVDVTSTPRDATVAAWRFVEIVDGEPLPETFATCAERALGGGLRVVAPPGFEFPTYHGQVSILYRLPATSADKS